MPTILLETFIDASADICFDLMRDVRIHEDTTIEINGQAIARVPDVQIGQTVTFEGTHFGLRQRLTVKVVEFDRPHLFVDEMTEGAFAAFRHVHEFSPRDGGTLMRDTLVWRSPFGVIGGIVDSVLLSRHLRNLVAHRNERLKRIAESRA